MTWGKHIDAEPITQFSDTIGFPFPSTIREKDIRNLPLLKELQGFCAGGNSIGSKHQHSIDIKRESVIQFWFGDGHITLPIMHWANGVSTIRAIGKGSVLLKTRFAKG